MERLNATDAKREFGEVLLKAQQGPVGIDKNGKPVAVMLSVATYEEMVRLSRQFLDLAIDQGLEDVRADRISDGPETIKRLRKMVSDAAL